MDFRQMLDDEPDTYDDGDEEINGIKLTAAEKAANNDGDVAEFGDDDPMGAIVATSDPDQETIDKMAEALDTVDDDFDLDDDEFSVREDLALRIDEHRDALSIGEVVPVTDDDYDLEATVLTQQWVNRAKAKAKAKTDERLYNSWHDTMTVDAAVFLTDGSGRGMTALDNAEVQNDWVKFPCECGGSVRPVSVNTDDDDIID